MKWIIGFLKKLFPNFFAGLSAFIVGFLGSFLGPFLQTLMGFLRKVGLFFLILAAVSAALLVFVTAIEALVGQVIRSTAPGLIDVGRMFLPSNLSYCIGVLVMARLKSLVFMWVTRYSEKFLHT